MIPVSNAYKELVKSNIRPKCEPIIKVSGKDNNGKYIELIWQAKNIKDLNYKRGIDPVGRELPYMELTWTEIYTGKLNAQNYPEKYNNITKYMKVELSFVQDLGFHNTWKLIFGSGLNWRNLFSKKWKQVKNEVGKETIKMPALFLNARPTINGQTITWVAKDLLSFANESSTRSFNVHDDSESPTLKNVISFFALNARGAFLNSRELFDAYTKTVTNLLNKSEITEIVDKKIICDGKTNEIILNLSSIYSYYIDFEDDIFVLKEYNPSDVVYDFKKNTLYSYPEIKNATNISTYSFKHRLLELNKDDGYYKKPLWIKHIDNYYLYYYAFNGYGIKWDLNDKKADTDNIDIKQYYEVSDTKSPNSSIYIVPITYNDYENIINIDNVGEVFYEDNPINPYDASSAVAIVRKGFLNNYFSNSSSSISFESLANVSIETGDLISVDTNLYGETGEQISKKALVVCTEIQYNGSIKQKIKAHGVNV